MADLDGDADPDIATAGQDIRILRNLGRGDFGEPEIYPLGERRSWEMLGADLDRNGSTDLIAIAYSTSEVTVLLNRGDGTFSMRVEEVFPFGANQPVLADFDGDPRRRQPPLPTSLAQCRAHRPVRDGSLRALAAGA